ncbi:MAG: diacylglycerol kinase family protein [Candidatus Nanopelagicales bacterium]
MSGARVVLVVNPWSGRGRAQRAAPLISQRLHERGLNVEVVSGTSRQDADDRLQAALSTPTAAVVACGGDGTVNLVLQQLVRTSVALAVAPYGTGNDAAAALHSPHDPVAVADAVADGLAEPQAHSWAVDVGEIRTADGTVRYYLAVMSSGFDSSVNARAEAMRWPTGRARYVAAVLADLRRFRPVPYSVVIDAGREQEQSFRRRGMLVAVGNTRSYGGGMQVCPAALPDDGHLHLTFVSELSVPRFLSVFPQVFRGTHVRRPEVSTAVATTVRLDAPDQTAYADGERIGPLPVEVRVVPGAVRVLVPPHERPADGGGSGRGGKARG